MEPRLISLVLGYTKSADSSDAVAVRRCENEWQFKVQEAAQRKSHRLTDQRTHAWIISAKDCSAHTRVISPLLAARLLRPRKRTSGRHRVRSLSCQSQKSPPSFDHLVSACEQRWWNCQAKRLGGLEIDH